MFSRFAAENDAEELDSDERGHGDHGYASEGVHGRVSAHASGNAQHEGQDEGGGHRAGSHAAGVEGDGGEHPGAGTHEQKCVGINLLREGLDIPEVSLVLILDADKEGLFRSERSLIQTIGRAARNASGHVIMYADVITDSMRRAMEETERRRKLHMEYNVEHGITPQTIRKEVRELIRISKDIAKEEVRMEKDPESMSREELSKLITDVQKKMQKAAADLNFEVAAELRDKMIELKKALQDLEEDK